MLLLHDPLLAFAPRPPFAVLRAVAVCAATGRAVAHRLRVPPGWLHAIRPAQPGDPTAWSDGSPAPGPGGPGVAVKCAGADPAGAVFVAALCHLIGSFPPAAAPAEAGGRGGGWDGWQALGVVAVWHLDR